MVALENGELGSLLSPGTVRGLEDECVTDVKVPETWPWGFGRAWEAPADTGLGGPSPPPFAVSISLSPLRTSEFCPKDIDV